MYQGYLIDLDGTAYLGNEVILTCVDFVNELVQKDIKFMFVSNNSTKSQKDVCLKLVNMGYNVTEEHIFTSAMATEYYLADTYKGKKVYLIGDEGLKNSVKKSGAVISDDTVVDAVVVGLDFELTYESLTKAVLAINNGAEFISTNPDRALPSERGMLPGNGAIVEAIKFATNKEPVVIGKPSKIIMEYAIKKIGVPKGRIAMIGDNYDTDILSGINVGIDTIYVETGLTTKEEVLKRKILPTHIFNNLSELM